VFTRSNNIINGVEEEMTGVGNDLMSPASRKEAAKATHMEELGCPCGDSARVGLEHGSRRLSRFNKLFK
jgi:hypothetical protein